jgi:hypothetical protein
MRRWIGIITVSLALVALHGGKWAAYVYCRLQLTIVLQQTDCDCAKVLTADNDHSSDARDAAAGLLKPSSDLFGFATFCKVFALVPADASSGISACTFPLLNGKLHDVFRPPAFA